MDYKITKSQILLVHIAIYDDIHNGVLIPRDLKEEEMLRPAVFVNHHIIDLTTGDEIYTIKTDYNGVIESTIYRNTIYAMETYQYPDPSDELLLYALTQYEKFIKRQEEIKEKKIIPFPQKCLFYHK